MSLTNELKKKGKMMKCTKAKLILLFFAGILLATPINSFAKENVVDSLSGDRSAPLTLKDTSGTALSSYALTSGSAVYSKPINVKNNAGFISILVIEDKSGGAGDVDISAEYSFDGVNFYTVATTNMSGTITDDGLIAEAFGNSSRIISISARLANYVRFYFDPDADSQITVQMVYQESR